MKLLTRIMLVLLVAALIGMVASSVARAKRHTDSIDSYISYLDAKYGW